MANAGGGTGAVARDKLPDPEQWRTGEKVHGEMCIDRPELEIVRLCVSEQRGPFAVTPMHHMVATLDEGIEYFVETHELLLVPAERYAQAMARAGLHDVHHVPDVFVRGAWIGTRPR